MLLCSLTIQQSKADQISIPNVFVAGQTLPASQLNANFNAIYSAFNGGITDNNISNSAAISSAKIVFNSTEFTTLASGNVTWASGITGDTQPRIALTSDGVLEMGPGGNTVPDTGWVRTGAYTLRLVGLPPTLDMNSGNIINCATLTGLNTVTPTAGAGTADQLLGVNHAGTAVEYKTLTAGANVTITPSAGAITISSSGGGGGGGTGTVTSVSLTGDGTIFNSTVSGSPITVAGTLAPALLTQSANTFLAGPSTGSAVAPSFRYLGVNDFAASPAANKVLGINAAGTGTEYKSIVAGSNVTVTPGVGTITIAATGGGGGGGAPTTSTYTTVNDETATLTNSRQWTGGQCSVIDTSAAGKIAIDVPKNILTLDYENGTYPYTSQLAVANGLTLNTTSGISTLKAALTTGNWSGNGQLTYNAVNNVDATSGNLAMTLPNSDTGTSVIVSRIDNSAHTVTITAAAGGTLLSGGGTIIITGASQYAVYTFVLGPSGWYLQTENNTGLTPIGTNMLLGNNSGGSAVPYPLAASMVTALLNQFSSGFQGVVPASGGGSTNFLRADGYWAAPPTLTPIVNHATVTMNATEVTGIYTLPLQVIGPVGSGKSIVVSNWSITMGAGSGFSGSGDVALIYGISGANYAASSIHSTAYASANEFSANSGISTAGGFSCATTITQDSPVSVTILSGAATGGTATMTVDVWYYITP